MVLDVENVEKVSKNFYKLQQLYFFTIGVWPAGKKRWQQIFYRFQLVHVLVFWLIAFLSCEMIYLVQNVTDLDKVSDVLFLFTTLFAAFVKYICLNRQYKKYEHLISSVHKSTFQPSSAWDRDVLSKGVKQSTFARNFFAISGFFALQLLCIYPLFNGSFRLPVAAYYPVDMEKYFVLLYSYQYIGCTFYCYLNVSYDTWTAAFQTFVRCQVDYLADRLRNIGSNTSDQKCVRKRLIKCIFFHRDILNLASNLESVMKFPYTVQIATSAIVLCLTFYRLSVINPMEDFVNFAMLVNYLFAMMVQIFLVCYFSNNITTASERLPFALFDCNWYNWNMSNKKLFLTTLLRLNKPIKMNAVKLYTFDLNMFGSILNCSYTYFALLRKVNN